MPSTSETIAPKKAIVFRGKPQTLEPQLLDDLLSENWTTPIEDDWSLDAISAADLWQQLRLPTGAEATAATSFEPNLDASGLMSFPRLSETVRLRKNWVASNALITGRAESSVLSGLQVILGLSGTPVLAGPMQNVTAFSLSDVGARASELSLHRMLGFRPNKLEALVDFNDHWNSLAQTTRSLADVVILTSVPTFAAALELRLAEIPNIPTAPDSVLPSRDVINATRQVASYLPVHTRIPEIEIDDSMGSISLIWRDERRENSFSLEIPSARYVVGVGLGVRFSNVPPWRHLASDERRIVAEIQSSMAAQDLMTSA